MPPCKAYCYGICLWFLLLCIQKTLIYYGIGFQRVNLAKRLSLILPYHPIFIGILIPADRFLCTAGETRYQVADIIF